MIDEGTEQEYTHVMPVNLQQLRGPDTKTQWRVSIAPALHRLRALQAVRSAHCNRHPRAEQRRKSRRRRHAGGWAVPETLMPAAARGIACLPALRVFDVYRRTRSDEQRGEVLTWLSSALVALKFFLLMLATSCRTCAKTTCPKLTTMLALQRAGPRVTASYAPLRGSRAAHELEVGKARYVMPRTLRRPQVRPAPPLPLSPFLAAARRSPAQALQRGRPRRRLPALEGETG